MFLLLELLLFCFVCLHVGQPHRAGIHVVVGLGTGELHPSVWWHWVSLRGWVHTILDGLHDPCVTYRKGGPGVQGTHGVPDYSDSI